MPKDPVHLRYGERVQASLLLRLQRMPESFDRPGTRGSSTPARPAPAPGSGVGCRVAEVGRSSRGAEAFLR